MIKRYDLKFGQMVDDFGYAHIDSDKGEWCLAEDVKALETENAELRERVVELLRINKRLWEINGKMFPLVNEMDDFVACLEEIGNIRTIIDEAIQAGKENISSPVDVEKGEEG